MINENFNKILNDALVQVKLDKQNTYKLSWIKCSDYMPPEDGEYFCTVCESHPNMEDDIYVDIIYYDGECSASEWCSGENVRVIAWMELPDRYRGRLDD